MSKSQFQIRWRFRRLHEDRKRGAYIPYSPASGVWQSVHAKVAHKVGPSSASAVLHSKYIVNQDAESIKRGKTDLVGTIGDPIGFAKEIKKDKEHYRVILAPKRGDLLNMETFIKNTVKEVENHIGKIDYAAAIHKPEKPNSAGIYNMHAHLIVRGGYNRGANWLKAMFREAAAREATRQFEVGSGTRTQELSVKQDIILEHRHIKRKT